MGITVHPCEPDTAALAGRLAAMPAGNYLGDKWRTEPLVLVALRVESIDVTVVESVSAAYPFHERAGSDSYLAVVPVTVGRLLTWHQDEGYYWATQLDLPNCCDDLEVICELLAPLGAYEHDEKLLSWFDDVAATAEAQDLPPLDTVRLAAQLAVSLDDLDAAAEAAVLTLSGPEPAKPD